ncbi:hypothetical protein BDV98DRAFT_549683 [Pterulicium gracile]|uniref:Uncharacterized protein n=1 Tax=Pterulicium gracile TaxID=1884261 RepID=A0A5C3QJR4_9AGAR|nr:hypothetical protein BDV98DRAFT_549683 [Pterula gracilis]
MPSPRTNPPTPLSNHGIANRSTTPNPSTPKNTIPYNANKASDNRDASPTSTISAGTPAVEFNSSRVGNPNLSLYRNFPTSMAAPPSAVTTIKIDHSVVTSFDPSDKELYDLWAPRK